MAKDSYTGAMTIAEFGRQYGVKRTFTYEELKAGRLKAMKAGSRTLIRRADAEKWLKALPPLTPA
jgi:excisionase family DNA binding protein